MSRWITILLGLVTVAVLAVGGWFGYQWFATCHDGVDKIDGECVGVSGDGYDFENEEISRIAAAIAKENKEIDGEPHVTVAMMLPLQAPGELWLRQQMRSDLQGAYLGQRAANSDGDLPKIRLLLANPGRDYRHQAEVVQTLVEMSKSKENLRAVTGFNLSRRETKAAVKKLTRNEVPVLASRISGGGIANEESKSGESDEEFPGLARIIPTNGDAARALAHFNRGRDDEKKSVLIYDKREDLYSNSLEDAFRTKKATSDDVWSFRSPANDKVGWTATKFSGIADSLCGEDVGPVYFAGRTLHLKTFAQKLAKRCNDQPFTIISGSDAASLRQAMDANDGKGWKNLAHAKVKVQYAAPAHPKAWCSELLKWDELRHPCTSEDRDEIRAKHGKPEGEKPWYITEPAHAQDQLYEQIRDNRSSLGSGAELEDSRTMLVYDGLVTIRDALHFVVNADDGDGGDKKIPEKEAVIDAWTALRKDHRIAGTSGLICLTEAGNPYDKPVSVVELDPARKILQFQGLAWPEGRPQDGICED